MATVNSGNTLSLNNLAAATDESTKSLGTVAGSTSTPISMSAFAIDSVGSLAGFTYVVESTAEDYVLGFTNAGGRFNKISQQKKNFNWLVTKNGGGTSLFTSASYSQAAAGSGSITINAGDMSNSGAAAFSAAAYNAEATLTDASTISWNAITQPVAKVTLGANRTLGAASGGVAGAFISLLIIQDGTGSRTLTWNAAYEFKDDTAPTLTTTADKGDLFVFRYNGSKFLEVGRNQNLTLS